MPRPFRLGFLSHLYGDTQPRQLFREYVELFAVAEELGFASVWVAQHHFDNTIGRLPSPFPFLAAVAERTSRIGLGTAVVTLPLEDPVRVAEDAAVLDALSGGRLELGVGSGGGPDVFGAFGKNFGTRREDNSTAVRVITDLLDGNPLPGTDLRLQPPRARAPCQALAGCLQPARRPVCRRGRIPAAAESGHVWQARTNRQSTSPVGRGVPSRLRRLPGPHARGAIARGIPGRRQTRCQSCHRRTLAADGRPDG